MPQDTFRAIEFVRSSDAIVSQIKDAIIAGRFLPGELIASETELADQFGVSRSTIREAIRVLESEGLVTVKVGTGGGIFAGGGTHKTVSDTLSTLLLLKGITMEELAEGRMIIEVASASLAANRATPENLAYFQTELETMGQALTRPADFVAANIRFHLGIAKASQNRFLIMCLESISAILGEAFAVIHENPENSRRALQGHQKVFEKIGEKDAEGAAQSMREHLNLFRKYFTEIPIDKSGE